MHTLLVSEIVYKLSVDEVVSFFVLILEEFDSAIFTASVTADLIRPLGNSVALRVLINAKVKAQNGSRFHISVCLW